MGRSGCWRQRVYYAKERRPNRGRPTTAFENSQRRSERWCERTPNSMREWPTLRQNFALKLQSLSQDLLANDAQREGAGEGVICMEGLHVPPVRPAGWETFSDQPDGMPSSTRTDRDGGREMLVANVFVDFFHDYINDYRDALPVIIVCAVVVLAAMGFQRVIRSTVKKELDRKD